jgi:heptosyltransferase-2
MEILYIDTAYAGDLLFAGALIDALKRRYPGARLSWLAAPRAAPVAPLVPAIDEVIVYDKTGADRGPAGMRRIHRALREGGFDLVVSSHCSLRSALAARATRAPLRVGFRSPFGRIGYNVLVDGAPAPTFVERANLLARPLGLPEPERAIRVTTPARDLEWARIGYGGWCAGFEAGLVALVPASARPSKCWPAAHFAELAVMLVRVGLRPVVLGGTDARPAAAAVARRAPAALDMTGETFGRAAAAISAARAVVTGDTALLHVATGLDAPTVAVFGPTDERLHLFAGRHRVVSARVPCRPCAAAAPARCPKRHHRCMCEVDPAGVFSAVFEVAGLPHRVPLGPPAAR